MSSAGRSPMSVERLNIPAGWERRPATAPFRDGVRKSAASGSRSWGEAFGRVVVTVPLQTFQLEHVPGGPQHRRGASTALRYSATTALLSPRDGMRSSALHLSYLNLEGRLLLR